MKTDSEENIIPKEQNFHLDMPSKLPSINPSENQGKQSLKSSSKKDNEIKLDKDKSLSSIKLKITEHQENINIKESLPELPIFTEEQNIESDNILFPNDYNSEESKKSQPKIIDGKIVININEIIGEEAQQPLNIEMIDDNTIRRKYPLNLLD